jgi:outer membrane protein OmpA-like peptidoglycan-associated protein
VDELFLNWSYSGMLVKTAIVFSAGFLAVASVPALAACPVDIAKVERAMQSASWQDMEALVRQVNGSTTCEPWEEDKAGGLLSKRLISEARKIDPALKQTRAAALIEKAAMLAVDWRSLELLGRQQRSAGRFREAVVSFQTAINLIANSDENKKDKRLSVAAWKNKADKAERATLATEADEAKHLAAAGPQGVLVAASSDRAGKPGGVFSAAVGRGAVGVRVPIPIFFEFNSAQLTGVGTEAAEEIASFLKGRDPKSITVTGHTDHVGSEAYNIDLSKRRAAAVAAFLKDKGVTARFVTVGKGFSEPWKNSQGANYTQSQIDELNRRVEFDWN